MKYRKLLFILIAAAILIYACNKKLNQPSQGGLTEQDIANKAGVEGLLIGAYSLLDGIGVGNTDISDIGADVGASASNWMYGSICGSEAYTGSIGDGDVSVEMFKSTATDGSLESKWAAVYDGVARANEVLRVMKLATDISQDDQKRIAAEARFLRGFYHFEAKKMWNNVPYIDETVTYTANNYHVANDKDIWPDIENDFRYAADNLSVTPYQGAIGRASKYPAMAFLAKTYMFEKKFTAAKPLLDSIIASNRYQLVNYQDNFNPATQNNSESIFSAQSSVNDGSAGVNGNSGDIYNFPWLGGPGGCCGFFQPSQYLVNHFKTDPATGLPDLDHYNDVDVKSDEGIESSEPFTPYAGTLDPRLDWTVGRRGIPYLDWGNHPGKDWIRDQAYGGPYTPKKNVFYQSQVGHLTDASFWSTNATANNVNLIRYADVLLWAAEAEVEIGSLDKAEEYVNMVRNRAANPNSWVYTYVDPSDPSKGFTNTKAANYFINPYQDGYFQSHGQAVARKAVYYERMLELGMEGHRFFDLVRWGIADTEINAYLQKESIPRTYLKGVFFKKGCNEYFAIPQSQIDLSAGADGIPLMQQNPCY
jgi:hypothetical protein